VKAASNTLHTGLSPMSSSNALQMSQFIAKLFAIFVESSMVPVKYSAFHGVVVFRSFMLRNLDNFSTKYCTIKRTYTMNMMTLTAASY